MTNDRWSTACHEAGHGVASLALGGQCNGLLLHVDGGAAFVDGLFQDREAYMIAAGPAAERLANEFDVPACEPIPLDEVASNPPTEGDRTFAQWTTVANVPGVNRGSVSDERNLALWAITGRESEPDTWTRRLALARHVADQIVQQNATAIVRIATALFQKGALTGPEIKTLYEQEPINAN